MEEALAQFLKMKKKYEEEIEHLMAEVRPTLQLAHKVKP